MNGDPTISMSGNLTANPDLRFTQNGTAVATMTVAHTPKIKRGDEWVDGTTLFMRVEVWRWQAEHVANSMSKGDRVVVRGTLRADEWTDKDSGERRTAMKIVADEIGASLLYAEAKVSKAARTRAGDHVPPPVDPWSGETATETAKVG